MGHNIIMKIIKNVINDTERAFYGSKQTLFSNITIDGPKDGESAFKESYNIEVKDSIFALRYPFWHNTTLLLENCEMKDTCRAALWYDHKVSCNNVKSKGVKAFRESSVISLINCDFVSEEIFWNCSEISIKNSRIEGVYAFFNCKNTSIDSLDFKGKYSFQYNKNLSIYNSKLDTKDAFWHCKNCVIENCIITGEYLAWYSKNLTFKNCKISGTQPFCYCKNIQLINCEIIDGDLAFENSSVIGNITSKGKTSIKNPIKGELRISNKPSEVIFDENDRSKKKFKLYIKGEKYEY